MPISGGGGSPGREHGRTEFLGLGFDTPSREELIAANLTQAQIASHLGVDSLGYISLDGMLESVPGGPQGFCHACFSGDYPTPPPSDPDKLRFGCGC